MRRKGQEEIVGFIVIMILVAVILLILLGIGVRKDGTEQIENVEVGQFLGSIMEVTSDCELRFDGDYASMSELIRACYEGVSCRNDEDSCESAKEMLSSLINSSFLASSQYKFESIYESDSEEASILLIETGECEKSSRSASHLTPAFPGKIRSVFEICI